MGEDFSVLIKAILDKSGITKDISEIQKLFSNENLFKIIPELETASLKNDLKQASGLIAKELNNSFKGLNLTGNDVFKVINQQMKQTTSQATKLATEMSRLNNVSTMQKWADNNSKAMKKWGTEVNEIIAKMGNLNVSMSKVESDKLVNEFKQIQNAARITGNIGKTAMDKIKTAWEKFGGWSLATGSITMMNSKIKAAIVEIKELDTILTEISKTSDLTNQQLEKLGLSAYDSASKYGKKASDYLTGVQEMSRSGFYGEKGTAMAEQSLLAQAAGDMDADLANKYVLATNAAYKFQGNAEKLNEVLDGQNSITNRNSVAMGDMATAMTEAGTVASSYRVSIEDLSAMIGTIESVTKLGGSEVGNAIKAILINLQNVTSSKIVDTLDAANASMTEMVNGTEKLRNPISILRDLAKTFNELDEDDPLRAEILTNIGQKYHAQKLGALLQNMDMYDKMLQDYSEGEGSAFEEAQKSANNLEGTINKLSNTWVELINNIISSNGLKAGVNLFNSLLEQINKVTSSSDKLALTLGTIGITIAQQKSKSGGLIRLINLVNNSPFLATVEFNSNVYDSYVLS